MLFTTKTNEPAASRSSPLLPKTNMIAEKLSDTVEPSVEEIACPLCERTEYEAWTVENGYSAVKCSHCGLIYVNPRPAADLIATGVETGVHVEVDHERDAVAYRIGKKVKRYQRIFGALFADVWARDTPISWLDVGAGYGEILESVMALAPEGSRIAGVEPMKPKADDARSRGLPVTNGYLADIDEKFEYLSVVNVFSHIPDFHSFMQEARQVLVPGGELFVETGNIGDLDSVKQVPTDLDLPDHLVFAGEQNMIDYLAEAGFSIVAIERGRKDGFVNFLKNFARKAMGRNVTFAVPYTSPYRTLRIRAKLAS